MKGTAINTTSILEYLKAIRKMTDNRQGKFYQWVLDNGRYFKGTDRDKQMEQELIKKEHPHKEKACYYNSQMLLLDCNGFEYYEGWYIPKGLIPIEHGFIVNKGKVIDLTINSSGEVEEYFGVMIPTSFVRKRMLKTGMADYVLVWYWDSLDKKV